MVACPQANTRENRQGEMHVGLKTQQPP